MCVKGMLKISGFTCNGAEVIALYHCITALSHRGALRAATPEGRSSERSAHSTDHCINTLRKSARN